MARIKSLLHKRKPVSQLLKELKDSVIKIDLGGGYNPQPDMINMDIQDFPEVDVVHDWDDIPWPFPDACAELIIAGHVVEHVNPMKMGFIRWMNEAWRILKYEGQMMVATPYAGSLGYWSDPTHCNPCTHFTWAFFDPMPNNPDLAKMNLYNIYKPKPWKIHKCFWSIDGNMEVLLSKRRIDSNNGKHS